MEAKHEQELDDLRKAVKENEEGISISDFHERLESIRSREEEHEKELQTARATMAEMRKKLEDAERDSQIVAERMSDATRKAQQQHNKKLMEMQRSHDAEIAEVSL